MKYNFNDAVCLFLLMNNKMRLYNAILMVKSINKKSHHSVQTLQQHDIMISEAPGGLIPFSGQKLFSKFM